MKIDKCVGCGAEIVWIRTSAGKRHPIDAKPRKMWIMGSLGIWKMVDVYETHFFTCPKSKEFSGKSRDIISHVG